MEIHLTATECHLPYGITHNTTFIVIIILFFTSSFLHVLLHDVELVYKQLNIM